MAEEAIALVAVEVAVDAAAVEVAADVAITAAAVEAGAAVGAEVGLAVAGETALEAGILAGAEVSGTLAASELGPVLASEAASAVAEAGIDGEIVSVTTVPETFNVESGLTQGQQTFATVRTADGELVTVAFEPSAAPIEATIPGSVVPETAGGLELGSGAEALLQGGQLATGTGALGETATSLGISDRLRDAQAAGSLAQSALTKAQESGALNFASLTGLLKPVLDLVGNDTAVAAAIGQLLQQAVVPLLKDLGGTFGKLALGVLPSLGVLSSSSAKILSALIDGREIPADSLLGVSRELLLSTRRIAGPGAAGLLGPALTLVSRSIPRYTRKREQLLAELGITDPATDLSADQRAALMDRLFGGDSTDVAANELQFGQIQLASGPAAALSIGRIAIWLLSTLGPIVVQQVMTLTAESYPEIADKILGTMTPAGKMMVTGVELLHKPMQAVLATASSFLFEHIHEELDHLGLIGPDEVLEAAPKLLAVAGGLGMSAHLAAVAAEKVHFLKELGFPQLAAFLVDMAGFSGIAKNTVGQHFDAALSQPSRRAALKRFRPELPDPAALQTMLHWRLIEEETVRDWYREHGWRDEMVEARVGSMWRVPSARELAFIFEDATIDEAWLFQTVQRMGYRDPDAEKVVKGIVGRSQGKLRAQLYQTAFDAFEKGHLSTGQLDELLLPFDVRTEVRQLYLSIATLKRDSKWSDEIFQAYQNAAAVGQYTPEELGAHLRAYGAPPDVIDHHQRLASIRNGQKLYTAAQTELKAEQRKARDVTLDNAQALYRRFLIDDAQLDDALHAAGIVHEEVSALVGKAKIARTAVPQLPIELSEEAQRQQALFRQRDSVLAMQRNGLIDAPTAEAFLLALGIDPLEASSRTNLVASQLTHPPKPSKPPKPDPAILARQREEAAAAKADARAATAQLEREQRLHRDAAITLFRGELLNANELYAQLIAIGYEAGEAGALVEREIARVVSKAQHDADKQAAHDEAAAERAAAKRLADETKQTE